MDKKYFLVTFLFLQAGLQAQNITIFTDTLADKVYYHGQEHPQSGALFFTGWTEINSVDYHCIDKISSGGSLTSTFIENIDSSVWSLTGDYNSSGLFLKLINDTLYAVSSSVVDSQIVSTVHVMDTSLNVIDRKIYRISGSILPNAIADHDSVLILTGYQENGVSFPLHFELNSRLDSLRLITFPNSLPYPLNFISIRHDRYYKFLAHFIPLPTRGGTEGPMLLIMTVLHFLTP